MLAALSWVPRGAPTTKLPRGIDNEEDAMEISKHDGANVDEQHELSSNEGQNGSEVDISEILANDLDTLAFHKPGEKDPYLTSEKHDNEIFDDDEMDDLKMRPTDSLIVSVKSGEDASNLEVHVFDDDPDASDGEDTAYTPHIYVHHDIVLPALPLCTAYTRLMEGGESSNLVAVGMFTPGIDIWDVDRVNNLEPVTTLGGYVNTENMQAALAAARGVSRGGKARRKRKPKLRLTDDSHREAVMSLSWNQLQREYLASGSADKTVKIWDIESSHCACTLTHHDGKVQAVAFHPSEGHTLASGAFDKTVKVVDVRAGESKARTWSVGADIETVQWGYGATEGLVIASTEDGEIWMLDPRKDGDGAVLARWQAHDGAASACSVSRDISGLIVTAGVDKMVKVWDVRPVIGEKEAELVYARPSRVGSLFSLALCDLPRDVETNASPFVVAFGGGKGVLAVADLAVESEAVRARFLDQCQSASTKTVHARAARGSRQRIIKPPVKGQSNIFTPSNDVSRDSDENGASLGEDTDSDEEDQGR